MEVTINSISENLTIKSKGVFIFTVSLTSHKGALHYENMPMQHTAIFQGCKNDNFRLKYFDYFHIFAQNIDCGYSLEPPIEAVLTSTHNLCFRAKIRKKCIPCKPHFYYRKVGCKGVFITRT